MRADPRISKNPRAHTRVWVVVGVAGLLCISEAVWRFENEVGARSPKGPAVPKSPDISRNESEGKSAEPEPVFDDRDAPPAERAGVDASSFYKDAFVLYDRLTEEEKGMMRHANEEVEAEKADALFAKIQPIMELLRRGAAADFCEWGLGPLRFDTPMPQIVKSQLLANVALWNAAYRFPSEPDGAIDDLAARARLGHDLGDTLIGWVVESSFERSATDLLRQNAPSLSGEALARAHGFLGSSTLDADISRAMASEMQFSQSFFQGLLAQKPEERLTVTQTLKILLNKPDDSEEARQVASLMRDPALLEAEFQRVQKMQAQAAEAMFWPDAQFNEWAQQFDTSYASAHPLTVSSIETTSEMRAKFQSRRIEREMLNVGLAVLESGPDQASRSRDPVTGRSFVYLPKPGGFELQSTFQYKGKPVTMGFDLPK